MAVPVKQETSLVVGLEDRTGVFFDGHVIVEKVLLLLGIVQHLSHPGLVGGFLAPVVVPHVDEVLVDGVSKLRVELIVGRLVEVGHNTEIHVVGALVPGLRGLALQLIQTGVCILLRDNCLLRCCRCSE